VKMLETLGGAVMKGETLTISALLYMNTVSQN